MSVIQKTYGFDSYRFSVKNKALESVIPFSVVHNIKGNYIISLPFSDYISTNDVDKKVYKAFLDFSNKKYPGYPVILKTTYHSFYHYKTIRSAFYHAINLQEDHHCTASFLRGVRKAGQNGLEVKHDNTIEGLKHFYQLYGKLRVKKFNSIPQPFTFFKNIFDIFITKGLGEIILVQKGAKIIAALIALKSKNTLFYKFGASDMDYLHLRPNNLLFYHLKQFAINEHFSSIDLGLSGASESYKGLRRFKESIGGRPVSISYFRIDPLQYDNTLENKASTILKNYTNKIVSQDLSLDEIDKISQAMYKNFA
jgi:hypothetical protein